MVSEWHRETKDVVFRVLASLHVEECWEDKRGQPQYSALRRFRERPEFDPAEPAYPKPHSRWHCDLALRHADGSRTWIECKLSWAYCDEARCTMVNTADVHHLRAADSASVRDVREKLPLVLGRAGIAGVGFLLVAFDFPPNARVRLDPAIVTTFERNAGLHDPEWVRFDTGRWANPRLPGGEIQGLLWLRRSREPAR